MSTISEKKLLTNNEVIKLVGGVIVVASSWIRMEYKFNETTAELLKKVDNHILSAGYEKDAMAKEISELREQVKTLELSAQEFIKNEFIKPSEPEIQGKRKRLN